MPKIEFFDEYKKTLVATAENREGKIFFSYSPSWSGSYLDPAIPKGFSGYLDDWQIEGLMERLPSKANPRYVEYCEKWQISPDESDLMTLLCTLGHRASSSVVCRPVGWAPGLWAQKKGARLRAP